MRRFGNAASPTMRSRFVDPAVHRSALITLTGPGQPGADALHSPIRPAIRQPTPGPCHPVILSLTLRFVVRPAMAPLRHLAGTTTPSPRHGCGSGRSPERSIKPPDPQPPLSVALCREEETGKGRAVSAFSGGLREIPDYQSIRRRNAFPRKMALPVRVTPKNHRFAAWFPSCYEDPSTTTPRRTA